MKTTYNVLCDLEYPVPDELLVHIAQTIRHTESRQNERRLARMTDEQFIRLENKQKRILRIYTDEGRLIQRKTSEATFRDAIRTIGPEHLAGMRLRIGRKHVILHDETMLRKRISGYWYVCPGYFLISKSTNADKYRILTQIDEYLHLNWEIELL